MKRNTMIMLFGLYSLFFCVRLHAAQQELQPDSSALHNDNNGYRIDKPGTITFTVGVKIKGKVEKPQVMIFLPKEKPVYNKLVLTNSFKDDIMKPLPFVPLEK